MRYGVIGSRTFNNYDILFHVLEKHYIYKIISGGAKGADTLAERYATEKGIPFEWFPPDYEKYGKKAPFVRNKEIVRGSDVIIAFWDMVSTGTKHSIDFATSIGIKSIIISI